jgi:hypothetical protein
MNNYVKNFDDFIKESKNTELSVESLDLHVYGDSMFEGIAAKINYNVINESLTESIILSDFQNVISLYEGLFDKIAGYFGKKATDAEEKINDIDDEVYKNKVVDIKSASDFIKNQVDREIQEKVFAVCTAIENTFNTMSSKYEGAKTAVADGIKELSAQYDEFCEKFGNAVSELVENAKDKLSALYATLVAAFVKCKELAKLGLEKLAAVAKGVGLEIDAVALEGSGLSLDGECIYVLSIQDGCNKSRSSDAVPEQVGRTGRFPDDAGVLFGSVYMDMVLVHNKGFRDDVKTFVDLFRKFFIAFREQGRQLLFGETVVDDTGRKTFQVCFTFSFSLIGTAVRRDHYFGELGLFQVLFHEVFRFVEEVKNGHLAFIRGKGTLRFPSEVALVQDADLFSQKFDLLVVVIQAFICCIELFLHVDKLVLQRREEDDKRLFIKVIQLFFRQQDHG